MALTFSSLFSMIMINSLFIVFIYILLKNTKFIIRAGVKLILFCVFIITVKFLLPFEFSFMKTIAIKKVLPSLYIFITNTPVLSSNFNIYLIDVLIFIWVSVSIFISIKTLFSYLIFQKKVNTYEVVTDSEIINILNDINTAYQNKAAFKLVYHKALEGPFIYNLKTPIIVIPKILLSNEHWYYILSHEVAHYYHKDLFYKIFAKLLSILYWWNPFIYLLKNQIDNLLEINIDLFVTQNFKDQQKLDYLECLLKVIQLCGRTNKNTFTAAAFHSPKTSILSQRVNIILANVRGTKPLMQAITLISSAIIIFITCSFCFILEPYAIPQKHLTDTFEITNYDSCYMIDNNDGTYDLYYNSKNIATVNEIFDSKIKIYQNEKEVK